ncbi:transcriptional regulator FlhC [Bordetella genomosp. 9]|uniref:flagellar transcriptional regulator FlhC n=1 Tax=Bordetella genomosp. 9 TaxID=1416803 RepID=UPI000A28EDF7|nr:flagellar transcriptional regulator FlhC [Bordetella genomosp. 9]ARP90952.1 transcriptional regulator FlhC [Bordetella genomosp. 9]
MAIKSVSQEADEILLASAMIGLGARLQVLESETSLSHDRLARLYREIRGCSPPKGMLPFSVDWFMTWLPNIHSSLFYNVYKFLNENTGSKGVRAIIDAYRLYLEHAGVTDLDQGEPVLSFTRAWMLVRFFDGKMLQLSECRQCGGHFIAHAHDPRADFVCAICRPPPRAGKTRAAARERAGRRAAEGAPAVVSAPRTATAAAGLPAETADAGRL